METRRILLAFCLLAAIILVCFEFQPAPTPPPREATLQQLTRRNDRMYFDKERQPFSGFLVERYSNGQHKARSQLVNGLLHGVTEGWFEDGALQIREHFVAGISHGVRTKWFSNGKKMSEANIENGILVGGFKRWHENGELAELLNLKNGEPEGESWAFYPSGYARAMARHENGALTHRDSWKDGEHKVTVSQ